MTFKEIAEYIKCEVINKGKNFETADIKNVSAGDMMSEVLIGDEENRILVTGLTTDQVVRTADIVEACGIILINGKKPQASMKELAIESDLTLISAKNNMFDTCIELGKLLGK